MGVELSATHVSGTTRDMTVVQSIGWTVRAQNIAGEGVTLDEKRQHIVTRSSNQHASQEQVSNCACDFNRCQDVFHSVLMMWYSLLVMCMLEVHFSCALPHTQGPNWTRRPRWPKASVGRQHWQKRADNGSGRRSRLDTNESLSARWQLNLLRTQC